MTRDEALRILREDMPELREKYRVKYLALFGSVARNEATEQSDIDLTVEFDTGVSLLDHVGTMLFLEELFGCKVDLVTRRTIKGRIRDRIFAEEIPVG
ncbi:MAG: nucleotidyltransferase family protein [bacterium]|nr:nucleotidyltransferase family protein [bacterium]